MNKHKIKSLYFRKIKKEINRSKDFSEVDGFIYDLVEKDIITPEEMDETLEIINNMEFDLSLFSESEMPKL